MNGTVASRPQVNTHTSFPSALKLFIVSESIFPLCVNCAKLFPANPRNPPFSMERFYRFPEFLSSRFHSYIHRPVYLSLGSDTCSSFVCQSYFLEHQKWYLSWAWANSQSQPLVTEFYRELVLYLLWCSVS